MQNGPQNPKKTSSMSEIASGTQQTVKKQNFQIITMLITRTTTSFQKKSLLILFFSILHLNNFLVSMI